MDVKQKVAHLHTIASIQVYTFSNMLIIRPHLPTLTTRPPEAALLMSASSVGTSPAEAWLATPAARDSTSLWQASAASGGGWNIVAAA